MKEEIVNQIWYENYNSYPDKIERFQTGNCHYVYGINFKQNKYILRIASKENKDFLMSSVYWLNIMSKIDIPIPKILVNGIERENSYVILNFIEGKDLGDVYYKLTEEEKKKITSQLVAAQKRVEELPKNKGYGYVSSYDDENYKNTWKEVVLEHLDRSRKRIKENGIFDWKKVDTLENILSKYDEYFNKIEPIPFLDDVSTKNVIINNGELSGIIDLDWLCFGDKLYIIALTNMALISMGADTNYIKYWTEEIGITKEQEKVLNLYTLIFCLDFMGEKGMKFNKDEPIKVTADEIKRYSELYNVLLEKII